MSRTNRTSPRKFSEKIALLNKKGAKGDAEYQKIIEEVERVRHVSPIPRRRLEPASFLAQGDPMRQTIHYVHQHQPTTGYAYMGGVVYADASGQRQQPNSYQDTTSYIVTENLDPAQNVIYQQQPQQQYSVQPPTIHMNHMSPEVPNIEIVPVPDEATGPYQQQVVADVSSNALVSTLTVSNSIGSARSLPDIANLNVASNFNGLAPSFSDQRIPSYCDYNYDTNSNIVSTPAMIVTDEQQQITNAQPTYCAMDVSNQQQNNHQMSHLTQTWSPPADAHQFDQLHDSNSMGMYQSEQQPIHSHHQQINYLNQSIQSQPDPIVRANSTNAVHNYDWQNDSVLQSQRINGQLSKSSEVYNVYPTENSEISCQPSNLPSQNQHNNIATGHRLRSISYNNIENVNLYHNQQQASTCDIRVFQYSAPMQQQNQGNI